MKWMYSTFLVLLIPLAGCAQKKHFYIPVRTLDGRTLNMVDSLSYKTETFASGYYVDSITQKPYTGKAIVYYGNHGVDSISLKDGLKDGWQRKYSIKNKVKAISYLNYFNFTTDYFYLFARVCPLFSVKDSKFAMVQEDIFYSYEIIYYKNKRIVAKQRCTNRDGEVTNKRLKFSSIAELEAFFEHHPKIYPYCKQAGFFGKPEIE